MIRAQRSINPSLTRCGRGFTLVEAVISVALVGTVMVAALNTVAASKTARMKMIERDRAHALAQALIAAITAQPYADPDEATLLLGRESLEALLAPHGDFDDVDDYAGWSASPPRQADGTPWPGLEGWTRRVEVAWVSPENLSAQALAETGAKRITVTVTRGERVLARLVAVRTSAFN